MTRLAVRVRPSAKRSLIVGDAGVVLRVDLAAPARENPANGELVRLLADQLGVMQGHVPLVHGLQSHAKVFAIALAPSEVQRWLESLSRSAATRHRGERRDRLTPMREREKG